MAKLRNQRKMRMKRRHKRRETKFNKCAGECKTQVTKILTDISTGWKVTGSTDAAATPKGADYKKAADELIKAINKWSEPVQLEPKCKSGCDCTEIDEDDVDWNKKKKHTRTFQDYFDSGEDKFIVFANVDFKVAIVLKACIEPPGQPIWSKPI